MTEPISIHAPRGGSDFANQVKFNDALKFQSTLPVGGATLTYQQMFPLLLIFQSTLPVGGATNGRIKARGCLIISIHAPRGGSDSSSRLNSDRTNHFNPRSPWGERLAWFMVPSFGRTISIHAPRGGSDGNHISRYADNYDFNPRSPWGERRLICRSSLLFRQNFNPRSPWGERHYLLYI